ncbi:MAG: RnfABCDGE type electron transport complex subunit D [Cyclobacteriaceae bacterium]
MSQSGLLTVSPSPHVHTALTVKQIMWRVVIAMVPALLMSVYNFGVSALIITMMAILFCAITEYAIVKYLLHQEVTLFDGSAVITGMLLAFNVPTNLPIYILLIGAIVAVGIGKLSFGGLGNNPFNPALVGRVFLLISFPVEMTTWPVPGGLLSGIDAVTGATPLGLLKDGLRSGMAVPELMSDIPSHLSMFIGTQAGSLGEMSGLAMLIGLIFMLQQKVLTWHVPITVIVSVIFFSGLFWLVDPSQYADPLFHVLSGGVMLGAIFMATDYVTSPVSHRGMVIFGVGIGFFTVLIRLFGSYPEGISFAILIMNAFVPLINKYAKQHRYGTGTKATFESTPELVH